MLLALAGLNDCGLALYHYVLPFQMRWRDGLPGAADSVVWALFALNFSWSTLLFLVGALVLYYAATLGPGSGRFVRCMLFAVGLFWTIHAVYTWLSPLPLPRSMAWLRYLLGVFPVVVIGLHWLPLFLGCRGSGPP